MQVACHDVLSTLYAKYVSRHVAIPICGGCTAGHVRGDILVGGYPKEQSTFARVSGYVEQV
jgi:hypothetical protein